ncbi:hypothetical protein [Haloplasma contractile]|uniref:Uncharacterized protein n=1 Tax=Haloplasma contractile SSD-17B TaxID=1033810 RepID=U2EAR1_9MOLU|nr:hypothetical protein [Haloplasma contractile]ERJ11906.1 hypothetical protein HLPCO_002146 [Haloplasma contractile SSD-17B]
MARKKCPACRSTDTVDILYGMPTQDAYESAKRGEVVLGGCCISDVSPAKHCKECGQEFGCENLFSVVDIQSFELYIGGFYATSYFVYIDGSRESKHIRYAKTPGGMSVDLKQCNDELDINIEEIPLTNKQWLEFTDEISTLEIVCWKDRYDDELMFDGTQWDLTIEFSEHNQINKSGSNKYPPYWEQFIKILKKYIDQDMDID